MAFAANRFAQRQGQRYAQSKAGQAYNFISEQVGNASTAYDTKTMGNQVAQGDYSGAGSNFLGSMASGAMFGNWGTLAQMGMSMFSGNNQNQ